MAVRSINNFRGKELFLQEVCLKGPTYKLPISSNDINCGVKKKVDSLFNICSNRSQTVNVSLKKKPPDV